MKPCIILSNELIAGEYLDLRVNNGHQLAIGNEGFQAYLVVQCEDNRFVIFHVPSIFNRWHGR